MAGESVVHGRLIVSGFRTFSSTSGQSAVLSRRLRRWRRAARTARTSRLASHEVVAAAVAGYAQEKRLQVLVDAEAKRTLLDLDVRLDLPPLAIHAQAPVVSHTRCSFTDHEDQRRAMNATTVPAAEPSWLAIRARLEMRSTCGPGPCSDSPSAQSDSRRSQAERAPALRFVMSSRPPRLAPTSKPEPAAPYRFDRADGPRTPMSPRPVRRLAAYPIGGSADRRWRSRGCLCPVRV